MKLHRHFIPGLAISSYLVGDEKSGEAVVIDPTRDVDHFINYAKDNDLEICHILETHIHADFVSGARELKERLGGTPNIYCSGFGKETQTFADKLVKAGDSIELDGLLFKFRHVPGHTPEHLAISLYDKSRSTESPWLMFSGDFLFVGDVGRPDLLGEEQKKELAHELYKSVFQRISDLPDFTEIFPAHGAGSLCGKAIGSRLSSTLGFERLYNSSMQQQPEDQWVHTLLEGMPLSPPYFQRMKKVNAEGPAILGPTLPGQEKWSARDVYNQVCEQCLIVDVRSKEAFAAAHIPNAINIPLGQNLPSWAGWVLPYERPTLIVLDDPGDMKTVATHLIRVGFDQVKGYLEGGIGAWETSGLPLATLKTMSVHDLNKERASGSSWTVLDVRTEKEWNSGHIEGAIHIHGGVLQDHMDEIPKDKPIAVVCGSGYRASIATSFLQREGYDNVANVMGGMSAWKQTELPTVEP